MASVGADQTLIRRTQKMVTPWSALMALAKLTLILFTNLLIKVDGLLLSGFLRRFCCALIFFVVVVSLFYCHSFPL